MCGAGLVPIVMSSEPIDVGADGMSADYPVDVTVLDHLGDEVSRTILAACAREAHSVRELGDHCDVSEATIYRRINDLLGAGLLEERLRIDSESVAGGKEYTAALTRIAVSLGSGGIGVTTDDAGDGAPSFAVTDPDDREGVVDLQLRLPEDRFGEFLSAWAELNDRDPEGADLSGAAGVVGSPNCD